MGKHGQGTIVHQGRTGSSITNLPPSEMGAAFSSVKIINITLTMLSEQYRLAAKEWCQLDAAANLLEESKSAVLSQMISRQLTPDMPHNRAEMNAKASTEWSEYITKMVKAREEANLAKVEVEWIRMKYGEQQSAEATARAESRL